MERKQATANQASNPGNQANNPRTPNNPGNQANSPNNQAFDKIIGYEWVKDELRILASILRNAKDYTARGCELPHGIMFEGEPGLGKTLMAECFIEASGCKSFTVRKTNMGNNFLEDLQSAFDQAIAYSEKTGNVSIVLLDDLDKYSSFDGPRSTTEEFSAVQSSMERCKNLPVFVIATVNAPHLLPESLRRAGRFGKKFKISAPSMEEQEVIVAKYVHGLQETFKDISIDSNIEFLARLFNVEPFSAMETALNYAVARAIYRKRKKVTQKDIIEALVGYSIEGTDRPFAPFFEKRTEQRMQIAIHEAGHVVVAEALAPKSVAYAAIVHHDTGLGGSTSHGLARGGMNPIDAERMRIMVGLGGAVATERELGITDGGFANDLRKVVGIAESLVTRLGAYGVRNAAEYMSRNQEDNAVAHYQDAEIAMCREKTMTILAENREFLLEVASIIYEKGLATYSDIQKAKMCLCSNAGCNTNPNATRSTNPNTDAFTTYDVA